MDTLPIELLRLIYSYCDVESVPNLRAASTTLAEVGYEYLLSPHFTSLNWRNDIDRLHCIALHERLRGSITSINIFLGELSLDNAHTTTWARHFVAPPVERAELMAQARMEFDKIALGRKQVGPLHLRADDLREACSALPNLRDLEVSFARCPSTLNNKCVQEVFSYPNCRKIDRQEAYQNLDAVMFALHGIKLSSFKVDRLPLEVFRLPNHRSQWFAHAQSFHSLSSLNLTLDPSGLQGPTSAFRAVNGLGRILQLASNVKHLKLAFHPYSSENSKFVLSCRELFFGFTYTQLTDLTLEGVSCDEEDLKEFLGRHGATLVRLRLGGRGLAKPFEASHGGIHLYEGTFRSLFTGIRKRLPKLERMHLEGIFDCEHRDLPSHESYNFYPLMDENWEQVPKPGWVRSSRNTISCLPFEQYVLQGGVYPRKDALMQLDD
ncbi:hypothetical protein NPX13_g6203 [Xylaria arbuscula]|uniref:F-box domain-containing protein n=1 Tax=Xylaria arbuscula TaxID=114810 RepID=A0A9W8NCA1_9PEZI|nr:hypothetical protein NPX13_g6203 [Xylaria arbuscula]